MSKKIEYIDYLEIFPDEVFEATSNGEIKTYKSFDEAFDNAGINDHSIDITISNPKHQPFYIADERKKRNLKIKDALSYSRFAKFRTYTFTEDRSKLFSVYLEFDDFCITIDLDILNNNIDFDTVFGNHLCLIKPWNVICRCEPIFPDLGVKSVEDILNTDWADELTTITPNIWFDGTDTEFDYSASAKNIEIYNGDTIDGDKEVV